MPLPVVEYEVPQADPVEFGIPAPGYVMVTLLLNVVQSAALKAPRLDAEAVGTFSVMTGVVVPVATVLVRSVPVVPSVSAATLVTVPLPLLLKVVQSVEDRYPSTDVVAFAILIAGVVPPDDTTGAVPETDKTFPEAIPVSAPIKVVAEAVVAKVTLLSWSIVTAVTGVVVVLGVTFSSTFVPLAVAPHVSVVTPSQ